MASTAQPDSTVFVEPSTRTLIDWTPTDIKTARSLADAGSLTMAADFCEHAMGDDRVMAALNTRAKGLVSLPLSFEPARGAKRVVKALEAGEDWWAAFPESALAQLLSWGIMLGLGLGELVWTDRGSTINRIVPVLKIWHPRFLRWDWTKRAWMLRTAAGVEVEIRPGDGKWILYTPYGAHRPWAFGAWRAVAAWALLKQYAISDWGRYSEKHGQGIFVTTAAESTTREARKEVARELRDIGRDTSISLPAGFSLELVEAEANTWNTFEAQKNAADLGTSVAILGQNMSSEVTGPVGTGATLHGRVLQTYIDSDAETFSTTIHVQALTWWAEFNFGNREQAPWPKWDTAPEDDKKQSADILRTVAEALNTLSNANAPVDVRAVLEQFKVPLKDAKDIEQQGQVFKYHLDYGALTLNEIRERLNLPPIKGGDVAPKPVSDAIDDSDQKGKALGRGEVRLRSGRTVRAASGVVQGQLYADAVGDRARERAAKVLDEDVVAVLEAIDAGESYDDIRTRIVKTFKGMNPKKLAKLTEAAITMAELGGCHAINEDADED